MRLVSSRGGASNKNCVSLPAAWFDVSVYETHMLVYKGVGRLLGS